VRHQVLPPGGRWARPSALNSGVALPGALAPGYVGMRRWRGLAEQLSAEASTTNPSLTEQALGVPRGKTGGWATALAHGAAVAEVARVVVVRWPQAECNSVICPVTAAGMATGINFRNSTGNIFYCGVSQPIIPHYFIFVFARLFFTAYYLAT